MILIMDGYNILKQVSANKNVSETQRNAFVRLISKYAEKRHHKPHIFFDGGIHEKPYEIRIHHVAVWYSGHTLSADDLIIQQGPRYISRDAALITSDRELINRTKAYFKTTFDPIFFYSQIKQTLVNQVETESSSNIIKTSHEDNNELDTLMKEAAAMPLSPKDDMHYSRKKSESLSKKNRFFEQQKKKL